MVKGHIAKREKRKLKRDKRLSDIRAKLPKYDIEEPVIIVTKKEPKTQ